MSWLDESATALLEKLTSGEVTSEALTQAYLDRIRQVDPAVGAFLRVESERALQQAAQIDQRRQAGEPIGRLGGLPLAIKDVLCTQERPTTCASRMLESFVPPYSATVVQRIEAADGVVLGKTNLDEFAMGGSTENSALATTRNPWNLQYVPGGSSGGAAACVAAGMSPLSLGSDTGGSIRQPAAFCGVTGLKPTYGRVSRWGLVAFASSLDQIGPLAQNTEDCALLLEVIAGPDPRDSTCLPQPVPAYTETIRQPLEGLRIGVPQECFRAGLDRAVEQAVQEALQVYQSLGASIEEITLPHSSYGVAAYYIIAPSEASSNLARYDGAHYGYRADVQDVRAELREEAEALKTAGDQQGLEKLDSLLVRLYRKTRAEGFGAEVKRRIMLGTFALSAGYIGRYYTKALQVRRLIKQDYDQAFQQVDLIAGPCTPTLPFELGSKAEDPLAMYLVDLFTVPTNLAGLPGMSLPCGQSPEGLPIGLHLQAPALEEERLFRAGYMFQQATNWHTRRPSLDSVGSEKLSD